MQLPRLMFQLFLCATSSLWPVVSARAETDPDTTVLWNVHQQTRETTRRPWTTVIANDTLSDSDRDGWWTVYDTTFAAAPGDLLRLRAQLELTNNIWQRFGSDKSHRDFVKPIRGHIRIVKRVGGSDTKLGQITSQNVIQDGFVSGRVGQEYNNHHVPLWTDAAYTVSIGDLVSGKITVAVQVKATRPGNESYYLELERGCGSLLVEQYRSCSGNCDSHLLLSGWMADRSEAATTYGLGSSLPVVIYDTALDVELGDLVVLWGQATTEYDGGPLMHGQRICVTNNAGQCDSNSKIGPWSTQNHTLRFRYSPLWNFVADKIGTPQSRQYAVAVHRPISATPSGKIVPDGGHIFAMQFKPAANGSGYRELICSEEYVDTDTSVTVTANQPPVEIHRSEEITVDAGDLIRTASKIQATYYGEPAFGGKDIVCRGRLTIYNSLDVQVAASCSTQAVVNSTVETVPLRNELLFEADSSGTYTVRVYSWCRYTGATPNPTITLEDDYTQIIVDHYSRP